MHSACASGVKGQQRDAHQLWCPVLYGLVVCSWWSNSSWLLLIRAGWLSSRLLSMSLLCAAHHCALHVCCCSASGAVSTGPLLGMLRNDGVLVQVRAGQLTSASSSNRSSNPTLLARYQATQHVKGKHHDQAATCV